MQQLFERTGPFKCPEQCRVLIENGMLKSEPLQYLSDIDQGTLAECPYCKKKFMIDYKVTIESICRISEVEYAAFLEDQQRRQATASKDSS